nr:uncharacterized protein LOC126544248 isoform X4 [Dermacentor andersoni]
MALQTQRYTLVGFSKELDRRSLHFVEPIPANRICKVCSLVPRMTAFLPCLHVVCKTCYEQCQLNDDNFCPLDGNMFREDDVDWRDFPADVLLRRQARGSRNLVPTGCSLGPLLAIFQPMLCRHLAQHDICKSSSECWQNKETVISASKMHVFVTSFCKLPAVPFCIASHAHGHVQIKLS